VKPALARMTGCSRNPAVATQYQERNGDFDPKQNSHPVISGFVLSIALA